MNEKNGLDLEKYKALYEFQKNQFDTIKAHYSKLEDKAIKYLTYTTVFITAFSLIAKYYLIDQEVRPNIYIFLLTSFYIGLTFIFLCLAIGKIFSCLQVKELFRVNTTEGMIDYFENNSRGTVYLGLAHHYKDVIKSYSEVIDEKADLLQQAFKNIRDAGGSLIIVIILVILSKTLGI